MIYICKKRGFLLQQILSAVHCTPPFFHFRIIFFHASMTDLQEHTRCLTKAFLGAAEFADKKIGFLQKGKEVICLQK